MKAIATTGTIDTEGHLILDRPLDTAYVQRVRVIVLIPEDGESDSRLLENNPTDTFYTDSTETVVEGIQEGWQQALNGDVRPVSELWSSLNAE
ncbi:MAG: hypothetical protein AAGD25_12680 [Cyanobacteria bacterium P01_F01_bin.150]